MFGPIHIPDQMNVFIVDGFYEFTFGIEVPEGDPMLEDNTSAENVPSNGDKKQGNDGHGQSEDAFEKPHGKKMLQPQWLLLLIHLEDRLMGWYRIKK
jgi:hypothetical protein